VTALCLSSITAILGLSAAFTADSSNAKTCWAIASTLSILLSAFIFLILSGQL
tara:strand:- start:6123 stop:6281 length:159 start_codon:yes stop_codon:yes gene_type:complete